MLSSAAVDSNNLQQGGWGPCLSVSKQALRQAGFHFFLQSTSSLHHHFCYHGTPDFLYVVFLVGWVRGSGEQALVKCKDSSTWQPPSDLTRENNLYMLPTMVSTVVCLSNAKGPQHGSGLQTQQERIIQLESSLFGRGQSRVLMKRDQPQKEIQL